MLYMRLLLSEFSCCYFHFLYLVTAGLGRGGAGGRGGRGWGVLGSAAECYN